VELAFDGGQVVEDVGVVELEVVEDRGARPVSYSSASITNGAPALPSRAETPKLSGTPPTRKPGARPALSSSQASIEVVVVLPCVPATAIT